jgi:PAS domain S-box-containing protein
VIFTLDTDQRHSGVFGRWLENTGVTPEMFLGKTSREVLGREAAAVHESANARALVGEHVIYEWSMLTPDGEQRHYQTSLSPMVDEGGHVTGIVGIGRDITALKYGEQDAIRLAVERERGAILASFIRDTSHEFANPISVIKNSVYLATHTPDPPQRKRHLEMINGQIFHIEKLVEGMILMSRLDSGLLFKRAPVYLDGLFDTIQTRLMSAVEDNQQTLHVDLVPDLPLPIGDQNYLYLAIYNLIENAVQYTPPGGTISVRVAESTSHANHLVIAVADTGIGIEEMYHARIFERFFRVDRARTERGAGLGLPIAQSIIQGHGGSITVESTPGQGSVFRVFLPISGG